MSVTDRNNRSNNHYSIKGWEIEVEENKPHKSGRRAGTFGRFGVVDREAEGEAGAHIEPVSNLIQKRRGLLGFLFG